jgi:hypothetical protein
LTNSLGFIIVFFIITYAKFHDHSLMKSTVFERKNLRSFIQQLLLPEEWGKQDGEVVKIGPFTDMCLLAGTGAVVPMPPLVQQEGISG